MLTDRKTSCTWILAQVSSTASASITQASPKAGAKPLTICATPVPLWWMRHGSRTTGRSFCGSWLASPKRRWLQMMRPAQTSGHISVCSSSSSIGMNAFMWWREDSLAHVPSGRYEREVNQAQRSAVKRIQEHDSSPAATLVLVVSRIFWKQPALQLTSGSQAEDDGGSQERHHPSSPLARHESPRVVGLELTDGWYRINAEIDPVLEFAAGSGRLSVGQKVITVGAKVSRPIFLSVPTPLPTCTSSSKLSEKARTFWRPKTSLTSSSRPTPRKRPLGMLGLASSRKRCTSQVCAVSPRSVESRRSLTSSLSSCILLASWRMAKKAGRRERGTWQRKKSNRGSGRWATRPLFFPLVTLVANRLL